MIDLSGIMTAIVTPLNEDRTLNEEQLKNLIEFQLANKVHSILALGGTGEYTALTAAERRRVVDCTVKIVNGRVPVVIGNLETGIGESTAFCQYCQEAGADAVLVMTPYYVHPSQQGLIDFYMALDKAVSIPLLVYNIPYRTCVNMTADTLEYLTGAMKNLVGIKECNNSPAQAIDMIRRVGDKINFLSGEEFLAVMLMSLGAKGAVMASANLVPEAWVRMYDAVKDHKAQEALDIMGEYTELIAAMFAETNPGPLKHGMELIGVPCGPTAIPLTPVSKPAAERLERAMKALSLI